MTITEGLLQFEFPETWTVHRFDEWAFYRGQFNSVCGGAKGLDVLALDPDKTLWLLEVNDYRRHERTKPSELPLEVACKVRDTLAALATGRLRANDDGERRFSAKALQCKEFRIVLHLEQRSVPSKLFPTIIRQLDVLEEMKRLLKAIDAHPKIVRIASDSQVPWKVISLPDPEENTSEGPAAPAPRRKGRSK